MWVCILYVGMYICVHTVVYVYMCMHAYIYECMCLCVCDGGIFVA